MAKKKLTNENYFSEEMNRRYVGSSQFKAFMNCEHSAFAELTGALVKPKTKALLMGGYLDAWFEGTLAQFAVANPEIFNSRKPGELKADYQQVEDIIKRIQKDDYFMQMMSGEKQKIFTGEIEGVPVKVKIDSMHPDKIVDLKLMKDFQPVWVNGRKLGFQEAWGYDLQAAIYREIVRQNTGDVLPFFIAGATKEKNSETGNLKTDLDVFMFTDSELNKALDYVKENIVHIQEVKDGIVIPTRCGECEYCRETKVLTGYRLFDTYEI